MVVKRIAVGLLFIAVAAAGFFAWSFLNVPEVAYVTMKLDEAVETLLVSGRVVGEGSVPLSFERSGRIVEILVEEGEHVFSGEDLARLDDRQALNILEQSENQLNSANIALSRLQNRDLPQARENLSQAEARAIIAENIYQSAREERLEPARERLAEAEEEENIARDFYDKQEELYRAGDLDSDQLQIALEQWDDTLDELAIARDEEAKIVRELENLASERGIADSLERSARTELESLENEELRQARLNVSQAESQLEQARIELGQAVLKAPFSGIISRIPAREGEYITVGQEICTLIPAASNTYIEAQVDEEYTGIITKGQEVLVSSAAFSDKLFSGKVDRVSPVIDPNRGTFQVRFVLDKFEAGLLPDLAVSAEIITSRQADSLLLEQGYTFMENDRLYVYIEDNGLVKRRSIVAEDLGRGFFLVKEGLLPGMKVLTDLGLEEGMRIRIDKTGDQN